MNETPETAIGATGKVASDIVGGLKAQPAMLALIVLNIVGMAAALYFLVKLTEGADRRFHDLFAFCAQLSGTPPP